MVIVLTVVVKRLPAMILVVSHVVFRRALVCVLQKIANMKLFNVQSKLARHGQEFIAFLEQLQYFRVQLGSTVQGW